MKHKECIVHIGMHKTGSTSIQKTFAKGLNSDTFYYFGLGAPNHGRRICSLFAKKKILNSHKKRDLDRGDIASFDIATRKKLIDNINTCKQPVMIISGEGISTSLTKEELEEFRDFLSQYFQKITIVGYVRTAKSYIESSFQQRVKGGKVKFNVEQMYPNYQRKLERLDLVFGRDNVNLWKFDPKSFPNGDVVIDFCNRLNIKMKECKTLRVNESLSKEALSLLYIYRKYGPGFGVGSDAIQENHSIISSLRSIGKTKLKFSPLLIEKILGHNKSDYLWLEKRLGENLRENMDEGVDDIKNEEDLLSVDAETVRQLKKIIGEGFLPQTRPNNRLEEVAGLIHALRMKLSNRIGNDNIKGNETMKYAELSKIIKAENPEKLSNLNEKKIAMIIKESFKKIKQEVEATDTGIVKIPGFGSFKIQTLEKEREGKAVEVKRTIFRTAKVK